MAMSRRTKGLYQKDAKDRALDTLELTQGDLFSCAVALAKRGEYWVEQSDSLNPTHNDHIRAAWFLDRVTYRKICAAMHDLSHVPPYPEFPE